MDRALDEIVSERQRGGGRGRRGGGGGGGRRNDYPRDGVRKTFREDRDIDSEWVHDKFDNDRRPARAERRYTPDPVYETASAKLRVENVHYDLTEEDLDDLFHRIGPVLKTSLSYDRAGRSTGIAYVTYETVSDAKKAVREFDGANAKGQPIRLFPIPSGPSGRGRNNYESGASGRSLADRITRDPNRSRSMSPIRHSDVSGPAPSNVDRYVPGQDRRSRSPLPRRRDGRREGGRRPGVRRDERNGGGRDRRGGGRGSERGSEARGRDGRPKKTQEELDAEMDDYWGSKETNGTDAPAAAATATAGDDTDMIE